MSPEELKRKGFSDAFIQQVTGASAGASSGTQSSTGISGRGGTATSLISEVGGTGGALGGAALGASLGSVVPGIGTLIGGIGGGILGGFFGGTGGRAIENKVRDDEFRLSQAAGEGVLSGAFGGLGGLGHGLKAVKGIKGISGLDDAVRGAAGFSDDIGKAGVRVGQADIKGAIQFAKGGGTLTGAETKLAKSFGFKQGTSVGGKEVNPTDIKDMLGFIRNRSSRYTPGGIKAGKPGVMSSQADDALKGVNAARERALSVIDAPLSVTEKKAVKNAITAGAAKAKNLTAKENKIINNFLKGVDKSKTRRELELLRGEADDLAFLNSGIAGNSAKATEGKVVREAIDKYITGLKGPNGLTEAASEYKAIKGDFGISKRVRTLASKNSDAKGLPVPLTGGQMNFPVSGGVNKLRSARVGLDEGVDIASKLPAGLPSGRALTRGTLGRGAANQFAGAFGGGPPVDPTGATQTGQAISDLTAAGPGGVFLPTPGNEDQQGQAIPQGPPGTNVLGQPIVTGLEGQEQAAQEAAQTAQDLPQQLELARSQMLLEALEGGATLEDLEEINKILDLVQTSQGIALPGAGGGEFGDLTADQQKRVTNLNTVQVALDQLEKDAANSGLFQEESQLAATIGGPFEKLIGSSTDPAKRQFLAQLSSRGIQIIRALGEVGNLSASEQEAARANLPNPGDNAETARLKLASLRELFGEVQNRVVSPTLTGGF